MARQPGSPRNFRQSPRWRSESMRVDASPWLPALFPWNLPGLHCHFRTGGMGRPVSSVGKPGIAVGTSRVGNGISRHHHKKPYVSYILRKSTDIMRRQRYSLYVRERSRVRTVSFPGTCDPFMCGGLLFTITDSIPSSRVSFFKNKIYKKVWSTNRV